MEDFQEKQHTSSDEHRKSFFLAYLAPILFFVITLFTVLLAGNMMEGKLFFDGQQSLGDFLLTGLPFGGALILILGAHAGGHYVTARKYHVHAWLPYFIPQLGIYGTAGAYTKLSWPIRERQALIRIFVFGPLAGFCVSWCCLVLGMGLSQIVERSSVSEMSITLGSPLILTLTQWVIHGPLPETQDIVLHPIAFAGWFGVYYNMWHLLPIGKLDGGRLVYAFWGYRVTQWVSGISIVCFIGLTYFWRGWLALAILGGIALIRFRRQYATDTYSEILPVSAYFLGGIAVIIFILSFVPVPVSLQ